MILNREKNIKVSSQWHQNGITTANGHIVATRNAPRRTTSHHVAPCACLPELGLCSWRKIKAMKQMKKQRRKVNDLSHCLSKRKNENGWTDEQEFKSVGRALWLSASSCVLQAYASYNLAYLSVATTRSSNLKKIYLLDTCLTLATYDLWL